MKKTALDALVKVALCFKSMQKWNPSAFPCLHHRQVSLFDGSDYSYLQLFPFSINLPIILFNKSLHLTVVEEVRKFFTSVKAW